MEHWDTRRNEDILPRWTVRAPYDGSNFANEYKGCNGTPPPVFADAAGELIAIAQSEGKWQITFPQASDNEVHATISSMCGMRQAMKLYRCRNAFPSTI
jgi:hypothetical protein